jgi:two-component sensor histidine kinase
MGSKQVVMDGPSCILSARQAETLALAIHELATNALEYGALSHANGNLVIRWSCPEKEHSNGSKLNLVRQGVTDPDELRTGTMSHLRE